MTNPWRVAAVALAFAAVFILLALDAKSQELEFPDDGNHHPPEHQELHHQFYKNWKRPDNPTASCCGMKDCAPVEVKHENGKLYVLSFWTNTWIFVPPEKIDYRNTSPDGRNHACISSYANFVYCFIYGQAV